MIGRVLTHTSMMMPTLGIVLSSIIYYDVVHVEYYYSLFM
jgi:hypothetical protein